MLFAGSMMAQYKTAKKAFAKFQMNVKDNASSIDDARVAIDKAIEDEESAALYNTWDLRRKIYSEYGTNPFLQGKQPNAAFEVKESAMKMLDMATKKYQVKAGIEALTTGGIMFDNYAVTAFNEKRYKDAFTGFSNLLSAHDELKKRKAKPILANEADYNDYTFYAGSAALQAGEKQAAGEYLGRLADKGYDKPELYSSLYNLYAESDAEKAQGYLQAGVEKYPDNKGLLITQINNYLAEGKKAEVEKMLNKLLEADPNNPSVWSTLGQIYSDMFQASVEAKDNAGAEAQFKKGVEYYEGALKADPEFFNALYNLGALHYSKAAQSFNLAYDAKGSESDRLQESGKASLETARSFFKRAEEVNPDDIDLLRVLLDLAGRDEDNEAFKKYNNKLKELGAK